ncbi:MAG: phosphatidate cytidylyltransferase [Bacteroidales bacterium]|nr:phosphatidate cytidylyltransferase [Bacteroidales bacterium]
MYFFVAGYLYFSGQSNALAFLPWFIFFLLLCIEDIFKNPQENMHSIAYSFFAQVYISLPMMLLSGIAFQEKDGAICYLPELLLFLYAFIWVSDSFAYLTGITLGRIGKHPFMSRISPKKTWEGFVGGLAFTVLAGYLVSLFFPEIMNTWEWMGLALVIALTGVTGDLFASLIKRCMGVKDFGKIMPGHGGMLDRIDSSLFAIPASVIYCYFIF